MRKFYYYIWLILGSCLTTYAQGTVVPLGEPTGSSQEIGITEGELSVSKSGAAIYSIPFDVPPGINGVVPQVGLSYNSMGGNDWAGYNFSIMGISKIETISSTKHHDGIADFDVKRLALNGERLMLKSGEYYKYGSTYETESYSNIKVERPSNPPSQINYIVYYPDGSKGYYGTGAGSSQIIKYWENAQGIRITYNYESESRISSITYGAVGTGTPINIISFIYKPRNRIEQANLYGSGGTTSTQSSMVLSEVRITSNGVGYKSYLLEHMSFTNQYDLLQKITEISGDGTKSLNPTVFNYNQTSKNIIYNSQQTTDILASNINYDNTASISGDFDGDSKMDMILYQTIGATKYSKFALFRDLKPAGETSALPILNDTGLFEEIFPANYLVQLDGNYQLNDFQGVGLVQNSGSYVNFKVLGLIPSLQNFAGYTLSATQASMGGVVPRYYFPGDFNGDGLTDMIAIVKTTGDSYFVNLDRRLTSASFVKSIGKLSEAIASSDKVSIVDYNGDGKSDIVIIKNGKVTVYSFRNDTSLHEIETQYHSSITPASQVLFGDYNGDGKSDFMIPIGYGNSYYQYLSIGALYSTNYNEDLYQISTKTFYEMPFMESMTNSNGCSFVYHLIPCDFDNDGKTDFIGVENQVCNPSGQWKGYIYPKYFLNTGSNFVNVTASSTDWQPVSNINHYALPVFLKSDKIHNGKDLCFVTNNKIYKFTSTMDTQQEVLVRSIVDGNGLVEEIHYDPIKECDTPGCVSTYKSDVGRVNYPNYDVLANDNTYVVSKLVKYSSNSSSPNSTYAIQLYKYFGAVTNFEGLGFLGFKAVLKTNWHGPEGQIISSVSKNDINKRGATIETYEALGLSFPNLPTPTTFISKTINNLTYTTYPNKSFSINPTSITLYNGLQNTSSTSAMTYDSYSNALTINTTDKLGTATQRSSKITHTYDNQPSGSTYYIGRLTKTATEITADSNTMTGEKVYTYTNNLLTELKEKGNNTDYITTTFGNDAFGNVTQTSVSTTNVTPRITKAEYDPSGIYLLKSIGVDGLKTEYTYYTNTAGLTGKLKTQKDPYGRTTTYEYNIWAKPKKTTDYLGKYTNLTYTRLPLSDTQVEMTGEDGSYDIIIYDDLGRKKRSGVKLLQGDISYVNTEYDALNRVTRVSEPYLGTSSASLYTTTQYDAYGRIWKITEPTGKINTYTYNGLTQTFTDGIKTQSTTKNAIGNIVSSTDIGGTISYKYYPNNNIKESNYNGVLIKFTQDGWGRKTKLENPNTGTYDYEYYGLGELKKQTTPKGSIQLFYDNFGKMVQKDALDTTGSSYSTYYLYNGTTQILSGTNMTNTDNYNHGSNYQYDQYMRIKKIDEKLTYVLSGNNINFSKTYTYDSFGRTNTETSYSLCEGQTTSTTVQYSYQNGYLWKITDTATLEVLYEATSMSARGKKGNAKMANGVIDIRRNYDQYGFPTTESYSVLKSSRLSLTTNFNTQTGNLTNRTYTSNKTLVNKGIESFGYDSQDRLISFPTAIGSTESHNYDTRGRIVNNNLGTYTYPASGKIYQQNQLQLTEQGEAYFNNREGLFNEGMENKDAFAITDPANVTYSNTKVYSGAYSLKINNTTGVEKTQTTVKNVMISNDAATDYIVSGWVYSEGPATELHLLMTEGTNTTMSSKSETTTGIWKYIDKTITVPQNITALAIRIDAESNGVVYFDDLKIVKASDATTQRMLDISYNRDGNPIEITESGIDKLTFDYDANGNRVAMFYGSLDTEKLNRPLRKYYSTNATNIEIKHNKVTGTVEFVTYIGGDGYTAPVAFIKSGTASGNYVYLLRDYQGTILQISNSSGTTIESRSFDAWGNLIKVVNSASIPLKGLTILDRGYTGHEHLQSVGLIHMNGRLYDPVLRRFLQPDNQTQDPFNTQNYNAYSYVLNNPLRYVDYSGESYDGGYSPYGVPSQYNGSGETGLSGSQQSLIGSAIYTIANNWDNWGIKDWFNDNFSNAVKDGMKGIASVGRFIGRGISSGIKDVGNFLGLGGDGPEHYKTTIKAPGFSNYHGSSGWQNSGFSTTNGIIWKFEGFQYKSPFGIKPPKHNPNDLNPATIGKNILDLTYPGGNNPKTYGGKYDYTYVPTNLSEYPAIGHDRRYDALKVEGASGLLTSTKAIGADWRFVKEEFTIAAIPGLGWRTRGSAAILGTGLGIFALPKTLYIFSFPGGLNQIIASYYASDNGITNTPDKKK